MLWGRSCGLPLCLCQSPGVDDRHCPGGSVADQVFQGADCLLNHAIPLRDFLGSERREDVLHHSTGREVPPNTAAEAEDVTCAQRFEDRSHAVVSAVTAGGFQMHPSEREIELIEHHDDALGWDTRALLNCPNCFPAAVHESQWEHCQDGMSGERQRGFQPGTAAFLPPPTVALYERLDDHPADIVPRGGVFWTRIAQPNDQPFRCGHPSTCAAEPVDARGRAPIARDGTVILQATHVLNSVVQGNA